MTIHDTRERIKFDEWISRCEFIRSWCHWHSVRMNQQRRIHSSPAMSLTWDFFPYWMSVTSYTYEYTYEYMCCIHMYVNRCRRHWHKLMSLTSPAPIYIHIYISHDVTDITWHVSYISFGWIRTYEYMCFIHMYENRRSWCLFTYKCIRHIYIFEADVTDINRLRIFTYIL